MDPVKTTSPLKRVIKQERAARTRTEILEAAIRLFGRRGILATTMAELAKAIRMTPGALYWHFPTKEDLLLAAIEALDARYRQEFVELASPESRARSARDQLKGWLTRAYHFLRYHREYGVFLGLVMAESAEENGRVAEAVRAMLGNYVTPLTAIVRYGQVKTEEFRKDVDANTVAHSIISTALGVLMYQNLMREQVSYDPVMALVESLFADGLKASNVP